MNFTRYAVIPVALFAPSFGCSAAEGLEPSAGPSDEDSIGRIESPVVLPDRVPRSGWFPFSDEDPGFSCRSATIPSVVAGLSCTGMHCDNVGVHCLPVPGVLLSTRWTSWFSDEGHTPTSPNGPCTTDEWITAFDCSGDYCDNMRYECSRIGSARSTWTMHTGTASLVDITASQRDAGGYLTNLRCDEGWCGRLTGTFMWRLFSSPQVSPDIRVDEWNMGNAPDWDVGSVKATCNGDQIAFGISAAQVTASPPGDGRANRLLCGANTSMDKPSWGDSGSLVALPSPPADHRLIQRSDIVKNSTDWAPGNIKLECAARQAVTGISQSPGFVPNGGVFHGIRCSSGTDFSSSVCVSQDFETGDAGFNPGFFGADWDVGHVKGQCAANQYIAGVSLNASTLRPHSILCCER